MILHLLAFHHLTTLVVEQLQYLAYPRKALTCQGEDLSKTQRCHFLLELLSQEVSSLKAYYQICYHWELQREPCPFSY